MFFQFKGYSPSSGKVEKLLRHNGRSKHSDVIFGNKYDGEILETAGIFLGEGGIGG